eukprot:5791692-Pyramimonas_sp.AAC.1
MSWGHLSPRRAVWIFCNKMKSKRGWQPDVRLKEWEALERSGVQSDEKGWGKHKKRLAIPSSLVGYDSNRKENADVEKKELRAMGKVQKNVSEHTKQTMLSECRT